MTRRPWVRLLFPRRRFPQLWTRCRVCGADHVGVHYFNDCLQVALAASPKKFRRAKERMK